MGRALGTPEHRARAVGLRLERDRWTALRAAALAIALVPAALLLSSCEGGGSGSTASQASAGPAPPPGIGVPPSPPPIGNDLLYIPIDVTQDAGKIAQDRDLAADVYSAWAQAGSCVLLTWVDNQGFRGGSTWSDTPCAPPAPAMTIPCPTPAPPASAFDTPDWGPYERCVSTDSDNLRTFNQALAERVAGNTAWIRRAPFEPDQRQPDLAAAVYKLAELARVEPPGKPRSMLLIGGFETGQPLAAVNLKNFRVVVVLNIDDRLTYDRQKTALQQWLAASGANVTVDEIGTSPADIAQQLRTTDQSGNGG